jgi:Transposase
VPRASASGSKRPASPGYAQAVRDALPNAIQVTARWHLWPSLGDASDKESAAPHARWATATGLREGKAGQDHSPAVATDPCPARDRSQAGRLLASPRPGDEHRQANARPATQNGSSGSHVPAYMVDPYRDHLRARREQDPDVGATARLAENRTLGHTACHHLLVRYLNQRRHLDDHPHLSLRRAARLLLTRAENLTERQRERLEGRASACPRDDGADRRCALLRQSSRSSQGQPHRLAAWTTAALEADSPHVHSFARGIDQDIDVVTAAVTLTRHNGRTEDVNPNQTAQATKVRTSRNRTAAPSHPLG